MKTVCTDCRKPRTIEQIGCEFCGSSYVSYLTGEPEKRSPEVTKSHKFVREQYCTEYKQLNNQQYIIYCGACGYVAFETNLGSNDERQKNLPKACL